MCELYTDHHHHFTSTGARWLNAVRKCLQTSLVPLLRPFKNPTCDEIWTHTDQTHSKCYLNPYSGEPSICDLGFTTWFTVFATVRSNLDWTVWPQTSADSGFPIAKEGLEIGLKCPWKIGVPMLEIEFNVTEITKGPITSTTQASTTTPTTTETPAMSAEVVIEREMYSVVNEIKIEIGKQYDSTDVLIYPFLAIESTEQTRRKRNIEDINSSNATVVLVKVIVAPRPQYDLTVLYNKTARIDPSEVMNYFLNDVESGRFQPSLSERVVIKQYRVCSEWECQNATRIVEQPPPRPTTEDSGFKTQYIIGIVISCVGVIGLVAFVIVLYFKRRTLRKDVS